MNAGALSIFDVARYVWRYRYLAFALFVLGLAPFVRYAYVTPPIFRASVVMAAQEPGSQAAGLGSALGQLTGLAGIASGLSGGRVAVDEEALAVMHSRAFTMAFLAEMKAEDSIADFLKLPHSGSADDPVRIKVARYFEGSIRSVTQDKKTGLYQLAMEWTQPEVAAAWANQTMGRLNEVMRSRALERSRANQKYLQQEAARADQVDVRNALSRLLETEIRQQMLASVTPEFAFRVIDPATTPAPDERVRPRRRVLIMAGGLFAALFSVVVVVGIGAFRART